MNPNTLADPEASCGSQFTVLPNGNHVWIAVGPAAQAWQSIRGRVEKIVESDKYVNFDLKVHFFMIGRSLAKASPYIMFFSDDASARRELRNDVRQSGALKDWPWVRLGDASPLVQYGHGNNHHTPNAQGSVRKGHTNEAQGQRAIAQSGPKSTTGSDTNIESHHHQIGRNMNYLTDSLKAWSFSTGSCRDSHRSCISADSCASTRRTSFDTTVGQGSSESSTIKDDYREDTEEESSTEDDCLSEPSESNKSLPAPKNGECAAVLGPIVSELLGAYEAHRHLLPHSGSQDSYSASSSQQSEGTIGKGDDMDRGKKRILEAEKNVIEGSNNNSPQFEVTKKRRRTNQRGRVLACPFWKKNPCSFSRCYSKDLKEVKHVKQHLYRSHHSPYRCCRCQEPFSSANLLREHLRVTGVFCPLKDEIQSDEISGEQKQQLSQRGSAGSTQEEQWYLVWDIVFPGCERPSSPYLDANLSEDLCEFREFFIKEGVRIVKKRLTDSGHWADSEEEGVPQGEADIVLSLALDAIYKFWMARRSQSGYERGSGSSSKPGGEVEGMENDVCLENPNPESAESSDAVHPTVDEGVVPGGTAGAEAVLDQSTPLQPPDGGIDGLELEFLGEIDWEREINGASSGGYGGFSW